MAAIITDQIRVLNAKNFVADVGINTYYSFIGLPNPADYQSDWNNNPPSPKDNFDQENDYWDTMIALKKINTSDVRQVVPKRQWSSGTTYDYYRHDYSRSNTAKVSGATNLYSASYFVINEDYQVYICLQNGTDPDNPSGRPSLDEPTFTDLEPRSAGTSGDGYIWKYLYTIKPGDKRSLMEQTTCLFQRNGKLIQQILLLETTQQRVVNCKSLRLQIVE